MALEPMEVIRGLITKTEEKKARWKTSSRPGQLVVKMASGSVALDQEKEEGETIIKVRFLNDDGIVVILRDVVSSDERNYPYAKRLYLAALESCYKRDATLEGMLKELEGDGTIGLEDDDLPF